MTLKIDADVVYKLVPEHGSRGTKRLMIDANMPAARFDAALEELRRTGKVGVGRGQGGSVSRRGADELAFIAALPSDGALVGNTHLQTQVLKWSTARYLKARGALHELGLVRLGPGRNGTVALVENLQNATKAILASQRPPVPTDVTKETNWYALLAHTLSHEWGQQFFGCAVEITAQQGSKATGGSWTRPDITAVTRQTFRLLPSPVFEVWTFEVKAPRDWSVVGVHEASAHGRRSTRPTLLLVADSTELPADEQSALDECTAEAGRLGVGLVVAYPPYDSTAMEWLVEPEPHSPDPGRLSDFLENQLSGETTNLLASWWLPGDES